MFVEHDEFGFHFVAETEEECEALEQLQAAWKLGHTVSMTVTPHQCDVHIGMKVKPAPKEEPKRRHVKDLRTMDGDDLQTYLSELQHKGIYQHIKVRKEFDKAEVWCESNNRVLSKRFLTNWLNRMVDDTPKPNTLDVTFDD